MARWKTNDIIRARLKKDEARIRKDNRKSCGSPSNKADISEVQARLKRSGLNGYVLETTTIDGSVAVRFAKGTPDSVRETVGRIIQKP